jgi:hypothetical protein
MTDPDEIVENISTGASISVDITRGQGTRDQEKWKLKGKGESASVAIEELREQLEAVLGDLDDSELGEQVRKFQPEMEDDEE